MMDDINSYTFDFKKEVNRLRRTLPRRNNHFLFVESKFVESKSDDISAKIVHQQVMSHWFLKLFHNGGKQVDSLHEKDVFLRSFHKEIAFGHLVSLVKNRGLPDMLGEENMQLMQLFTLYHETAHGLINRDSEENDDHPFRESTADAYAALCFFQRFGSSAENILSMISWQRSINAFFGETSNVTTTVLDKIIVDSASCDFSKLSSEETVELARTYAKEWTPKASVLSAAMPFLTQEYGLRLSSIRRTCLASVNDFAFYIGAKFFQPLMHPGGVTMDGRTTKLTDKKRLSYIQDIEERASTMTFRDIFNSVSAKASTVQTSVETKFMNGSLKAEPSLTEYLKVALPAGQEHFTSKLFS